MTDCIFCKIANKEIKAKIEFESEDMVAFHDVNPQAPVHILVIPKRHIEKISDMGSRDLALAGKMVFTAKEIAQRNAWSDYRLVWNNGPGAGQSVYHIHCHLLSGRRMNWPPG